LRDVLPELALSFASQQKVQRENVKLYVGSGEGNRTQFDLAEQEGAARMDAERPAAPVLGATVF
jgi:hypothetical protein